MTPVREAPSAFSRAVSITSAVLVLALVAYLAAQAVGERSPARVVVRAAERAPVSGTVVVDVVNVGDGAASEVVVAIQGGAATTIDYLAGHERRSVVLVGEGEARVVSWQEP